MTEDEDDGVATRESPMAGNGGLATSDPHPFIPVPRKGHPPVACPNPRIMPSTLGYYRCPCCGEKVRHDSHVTGRESGYAMADTIGYAVSDGIKWAWEIAWPSFKTLITWTARAIKWAFLHAIPTRKEDDTHAAMVRHGQADRPGPQEPGTRGPQEGEGPAPQHEAAEEIPRVLVCPTSDGQHVYQHQDGQLRCHICGTAPAGNVITEGK